MSENSKKAEISHVHIYPGKATVIYEYLYKCTIENFSKLEKDKIIISSPFYLEPVGEWHTECKIKGYPYFCFNRHYVEPEIDFQYNLTAFNAKGKVLAQKEGNVKFGKDLNSEDLYPSSEIKTDDLIYDMIIITVEIKITHPPDILKNSRVERSPPTVDIRQLSLVSLQKDYKNLLDNHKHTDTVLKIDEQETLDVHRAILAARSPVFGKMFEQKGTVEQIDKIVSIEDMELSTLKELVAFLYSGLLTDYDFETAMKVYYASDKYEVLELRQHCSDRIEAGLTTQNRSRALLLAMQHSDQDLEDKIFKFLAHQHEENKTKR